MFNEQIYSKLTELPTNWKELLKPDDEIEFGYHDVTKDPYYFERDLIITVKPLE